MIRVLAPLALLLLVSSCSDVKQQQPPRIPDDAMEEPSDSGDMDGGESKTIEVSKDDGPKETPAQKRQKCCQQCVDGIEDDTSGDPPGAIPCTKLTSKMEAGCVVWHDKNPMTGGEAQVCAEDAPAEPGEEGDGADLD